MPTEGAPTDCVIRQNPAPINRPGSVSWIPVCAGMTEGVAVRHLPRMAKGLSGWQPTFSFLVVIPAQAGIQWFI